MRCIEVQKDKFTIVADADLGIPAIRFGYPIIGNIRWVQKGFLQEKYADVLFERGEPMAVLDGILMNANSIWKGIVERVKFIVIVYLPGPGGSFFLRTTLVDGDHHLIADDPDSQCCVVDDLIVCY